MADRQQEARCDCHLYERQVCDVCQGVIHAQDAVPVDGLEEPLARALDRLEDLLKHGNRFRESEWDGTFARALAAVGEVRAEVARLTAREKQLLAVLDELRGAYDDYYSGDGPERLTRLLNAEPLVRDIV